MPVITGPGPSRTTGGLPTVAKRPEVWLSYHDLTLERRGPVALLTLRRPEKLNALGAVLHDEIERAGTEVEADDSLRALIITGEGRGFSAGADLTPVGGRPDPDAVPPQSDRLDEFG